MTTLFERSLRSLRPLRPLLLAMPVLMAAAVPADAVENSDFILQNAKQLGALCAANTDAAAIHMCEGFLVGVHRMYQAVADALGERLYCLPTGRGLTRDKVAEQYAAWANNTASAATMTPVDGALEFAHLNYPCR